LAPPPQLRLKVVGDGVVDVSGFAAIPYDMEDVSDDEEEEEEGSMASMAEQLKGLKANPGP